jgi:intracellular sulfur oxidation DsrE/DsrF family protein
MILGLRNNVLALLLVFGLSLAFGLGVLHASEGGHNDPTHANASSEMSNPLELRTDFAIFSLLVFLALLAVLYALAWKPLMKGLDLREKLISGQVEEARAASEQAAAKLKEYEAKLAEAAVQAQDMVVQAKKDAEHVAERLGVAPIEVAVCSTGLIGERLPVALLLDGVEVVGLTLPNLSKESQGDVQRLQRPPARARQAGLEPRQVAGDGLGRLDGGEQADHERLISL